MNARRQGCAIGLGWAIGWGLLAACAPDLAEDPSGMGEIVQSPVTTVRDEATGLLETRVAAVDSSLWVAFSFDAAGEVFVRDPEQSEAWDLRFSRFNIRVNGGVSGPGRVDIALFPNTPFEDLTAVPSSGYATDEPDGDGDGDPELAFRRPNAASENGWFTYDPRFHSVTPAPIVYAVRAMNGTTYKLEFLGFYDEFGEGGYVRFRWAVLGVAAR